MGLTFYGLFQMKVSRALMDTKLNYKLIFIDI